MDKWMGGWMDAEYYDLLRENMLNCDFSTVFMMRYNSW